MKRSLVVLQMLLSESMHVGFDMFKLKDFHFLAKNFLRVLHCTMPDVIFKSILEILRIFMMDNCTLVAGTSMGE